MPKRYPPRAPSPRATRQAWSTEVARSDRGAGSTAWTSTKHEDRKQ